jgi:uncharacterized protein with von Willebrand factor type A (vWA) domain
MTDFRVRTAVLDLPPLVGALARRLHDAGVPVDAERAARLAQALAVVRPVARRRLYWTVRSVLVSDLSQVPIFDRVFAAVFGGPAERPPEILIEDVRQVPAQADERPDADRVTDRDADASPDEWSAGASPAPSREPDSGDDTRELPVPTVATDEEVIRAKRFDALEPDELAALYALMSKLSLATPRRRTRRYERGRHGARVDLRRTMRSSLRTGGEPIRLARRRRRVERRRIVLLCDISGSMEPYARAYLQFLTCAAGSGVGAGRNEAFAFATRLTRLTRALRSRHPERAIAQASQTAPDWSSGTRIGEALKTFNDRHGRRGMARGAVVVILSDGWERGDPTLVGREMERLSRLAYRIVWVNPRAAAVGFAPRAGGMAAALPYCDALVSGHSLAALDEVAEAIAAERWRDRSPQTSWRPPEPETETAADEEPWASAEPVPGSSVAMPSGYGPSRGHTTPGWSIG